MENLLILSYLSSFVMILSIHLHSYHRRISICFIDGNLSGWTGHRFVLPSSKRYDLYALLHARNAYLITLIPLMAIEQSRSMYHFHKVRSNRTFFLVPSSYFSSFSIAVRKIRTNISNVFNRTCLVRLSCLLQFCHAIFLVSFPVNFARWWWCSTRSTKLCLKYGLYKTVDRRRSRTHHDLSSQNNFF